jgi:hypothetical protein
LFPLHPAADCMQPALSPSHRNSSTVDVKSPHTHVTDRCTEVSVTFFQLLLFSLLPSLWQRRSPMRAYCPTLHSVYSQPKSSFHLHYVR